MATDELRSFLGSVQAARFDYARAVDRVRDLQDRCESVTANWSSEPHGGGDVHKDGPLVALAQARKELKPLYYAWERAEEEVEQFLDGIEAFNAHPHHNSRVAVASRAAHSDNQLFIAGTDFHHPGHQGLSATLTRFVPKTGADIVSILRSGDYLSEIGGSLIVP